MDWRVESIVQHMEPDHAATIGELVKLNEEMMKVFKDKVVGFPTLMEVIK